MNIIEIGANDGTDTLKFAKNGKVWAFEPNPYYVSILNEKFKNNKNISIIEKAVSDFDGTAVFNIDKIGYSSSLNKLSNFTIKNNLIKYESNMIVNVTRMDTFLIENNIEVIDYFHCDAQGSDLTILKSFGNMLSVIRGGVIEVSFNDELYDGVVNHLKDAINFLKENKFTIDNLPEILKNIKRYDGNLKFHKNVGFI
jgi:FkbM family methyltransferase